MQISDAFIRVHIGKARAIGISGLDVSLDSCFLIRRQSLDFGYKIPEAVVEIDAELLKHRSVFGDEIFEENFHCMAKEDRVRDLHHRRFEMQRKQHAFSLGAGDLSFIKGRPRRLYASLWHPGFHPPSKVCCP
jgi:hypothetical protein